MLGDVDSRTLFLVLMTTLSGLVGVVAGGGGEILTGESLVLVGEEEDLAVVAEGGMAKEGQGAVDGGCQWCI